MSELVVENLTLFGTAIGAGAAGAFLAHLGTKRQIRKYKGLPERRADDAIIKRAVEATRIAVEESMQKHLGTKNGEIKDDMAHIRQTMANVNAFMTVSCPSKHEGVNARLDTQEQALKEFRDCLK